VISRSPDRPGPAGHLVASFRTGAAGRPRTDRVPVVCSNDPVTSLNLAAVNCLPVQLRRVGRMSQTSNRDLRAGIAFTRSGGRHAVTTHRREAREDGRQ
jgi:hypothetical protein